MNYRQKEAQLDFQTAIRQLNEVKAERDRYKKALMQIIDRSNCFSNSIAYKIASVALKGSEKVEDLSERQGISSRL